MVEHGMKHPEDYSYEDVKRIVSNIPDLQTKALSCIAYLTGARVSELNKIEKEHIFLEGNHLKIRCIVLKKKNKIPSRKVGGRLDEEWLVNPIFEYMEVCPTEVLFPYHRATLFTKLKTATGFNPHFFRKLRATHLRREHKFDSYQLKKFFKWSSVTPSESYVGLDDNDILY